MAIMALMEINTHRDTPRIMGFHPADLIFSTERPAPIKNSVSTNNDFEIDVILPVIIVGMGK